MTPLGRLCRTLALAAMWLPIIWLSSFGSISVHSRADAGEAENATEHEHGVNNSTEEAPVKCRFPCIHGTCLANNTCFCDRGYTGFACREAICSPVCQNGSLCIRPDYCLCINGFIGPSCKTDLSTVGCVRPCLHGRCVFGTCVCHSGYTGPICNREICASTCVHGYCKSGKCLCHVGYSGPECTEEHFFSSWLQPLLISVVTMIPILLFSCAVVFAIKGSCWKWRFWRGGCCRDCIAEIRDKKMTPAEVQENVYQDISIIFNGRT